MKKHTPVSTTVVMAEPSGSGKPSFVHVQRKYVPALNSRIPSYGVQSTDDRVVVVYLSDKIPEGFLPLLQAEMNKHFTGAMPLDPTTLHYVERLTNDFLTYQVVSGNLRFDKVTEMWRWLGEPCR